MRVTWRDGVATIAVAAATVLYLLWNSGSVAEGTSVRAMAGILFALGFVGCVSSGAQMASVYAPGERTESMSYTVAATVLGLVVLVAGLIAIIGPSETALGVFVVAMLALWAIATLRHAAGTRVAPAPR